MANEDVASFEVALEELESILEVLERDELRLDEAMALFEEGVAHLRAANRRLTEAGGRVEELIADAAGDLRTVELDVPPEESGGDGG